MRSNVITKHKFMYVETIIATDNCYCAWQSCNLYGVQVLCDGLLCEWPYNTMGSALACPTLGPRCGTSPMDMLQIECFHLYELCFEYDGALCHLVSMVQPANLLLFLVKPRFSRLWTLPCRAIRLVAIITLSKGIAWVVHGLCVYLFL